MGMTHDELQALAHDHLVQQFARNGAFGPGLAELPVWVRGEGCEVIDSRGERYIDGLSSLFCMQLGYDHGEEIAEAAAAQLRAIPFTTNWSTAIARRDRAGRRAGRARARRHQPRLLHLRRLGGGRVGVEDRPAALRA